MQVSLREKKRKRLVLGYPGLNPHFEFRLFSTKSQFFSVLQFSLINSTVFAPISPARRERAKGDGHSDHSLAAHGVNLFGGCWVPTNSLLVGVGLSLGGSTECRFAWPASSAPDSRSLFGLLRRTHTHNFKDFRLRGLPAPPPPPPQRKRTALKNVRHSFTAAMSCGTTRRWPRSLKDLQAR